MKYISSVIPRIKGREFNLLNLLGSEQLATQFEGGSLAVFRLAPADYHRFHCPADVAIGETFKYPGYDLSWKSLSYTLILPSASTTLSTLKLSMNPVSMSSPRMCIKL
jgi:phosphatidylserine decarboxylase